MKILAFESSCDETAVAVVEDGRRVLSDAIASQADLHALYGGVVPELASRKHVEVIAALTEKALADAGCTRQDIDAVAVTYAPGLIGAVLVGLSFAKSVAYGLGVPLIPVHHVRGHIAANYLAFPELKPPFLALAISGGNTMIVDVRDYTDLEILGATRDDAAGECFDKAARVLGLPYPGGAPMDKLAQQSKGGVYTLPHSHVEGAPLDMSFSGLKTAVVNLAHHAEQVGEPLDAPALARDFAQAVSDTLVPRVMEAAKQSIVEADEDMAMEALANAEAEGVDLVELLSKGYSVGMKELGDLFGMGEIFLPELIFATEVMKTVSTEIEGKMDTSAVQKNGTLIIGTVEGDIHDIGKSIVASLVKTNGIEVIDLGREVPAKNFADAAIEHNADFVGSSALLTTTMTVQKDVEEALKEAGIRDKVKTMVGGAPVTNRWAEKIGADAYCEDASDTVNFILDWVANR